MVALNSIKLYCLHSIVQEGNMPKKRHRDYKIDITKPKTLVFILNKNDKKTGKKMEVKKEISATSYTKLDLFVLRLLTKPMSAYDLRVKAERKISIEDIRSVLDKWRRKSIVKAMQKPIIINGILTKRTIYDKNFTNQIPVIL